MNIRSYRWTSAASILSLALLLVSAARIARADAITQWNATMCNMGANGLPPFMESRVYAMAHLAMLEALRDDHAAQFDASASGGGGGRRHRGGGAHRARG